MVNNFPVNSNKDDDEFGERINDDVPDETVFNENGSEGDVFDADYDVHDDGVDDVDGNDDEESDEEVLTEEQKEELEYEKLQMKSKYIETMPRMICLEWLQEQNLVEWSQENDCYKFLYSETAWDYLMTMHEARLNGNGDDDHYSDLSDD